MIFAVSPADLGDAGRKGREESKERYIWKSE
jgi:hypothetical protein